MKPLEVKGQGVIEGVMMRNNDRYVLAMRKENKEIGFIHEDCSDRGDKIPLLRGISAFLGEIFFGIKAITSASDYREEHSKNKTTAMEKLFNKLFGRTGDEMFMGIVVLLSVAMSVGLFIILPYKGGEYFAQTYFRNRPIVRMGIEAIFRAVVFFIYLIYLSTKKDMRRMFMYHGAANMTLNCLEKGEALSIDNVRRYSYRNKGSNDKIVLTVLFYSSILMSFVRHENVWVVVGIKVSLLLIVAALIYEIVRPYRNGCNGLVNLLNIPTGILQGFITKKPKDEMIEIAIAAVNEVFDWRAYYESMGIYTGDYGTYDPDVGLVAQVEFMNDATASMVMYSDDINMQQGEVFVDNGMYTNESYMDPSMDPSMSAPYGYADPMAMQGAPQMQVMSQGMQVMPQMQGQVTPDMYQNVDTTQVIDLSKDLHETQVIDLSRDLHETQVIDINDINNRAMTDYNSYNQPAEPYQEYEEYEEYDEQPPHYDDMMYDDYNDGRFYNKNNNDYRRQPDRREYAENYEQQMRYDERNYQNMDYNEPEYNYNEEDYYEDNNYDRQYGNDNYDRQYDGGFGYEQDNMPDNMRNYMRNNREEGDAVTDALDRMFDDDNY